MINRPPGPRRLWTNYLSMAAVAGLQQFPFPTPDDYRTRYVETVFVGLATAGISIALLLNGQELSVVDLTRFANGDSPLKVDITLPPRIQLFIGLQDIAAGAHANVPIVVGYVADPTAGP